MVADGSLWAPQCGGCQLPCNAVAKLDGWSQSTPRDIVQPLCADLDGTSAVKRLLTWIRRKQLVLGSDQFLFPERSNTNWLRKQVKRVVERVGLNPKRYGNHSFRAGGATDLFVARVPYYAIKKAGRWKSDAALVYYRDDDDVQAVYHNVE